MSESNALLTDDDIDVLRAVCELLTDRFAGVPSESSESQSLFADAENLYQFASTARWPEPDFDERDEVLSACAFLGWRIARRLAPPAATDVWQVRHAATASTLLVQPLAMQDCKTDLNSTPETLLPLLENLRQRWESSPASVLEEATFLYKFLLEKSSHYPVDAFLLDERDYFLGETARIAGTVSRDLSRRDEAFRWFDLAEGWFLQTENASGNLAKLAYQRLALRLESREFEAVAELLPQLIATFDKLGMAEDSLKARFLQAAILKETDRLSEALELFAEIAKTAGELRNDSLLAAAYGNLVQLHASLGNVREAMSTAQEAAALLRRVGNRIGLAKLQWGLGYLLRSKGEVESAVQQFRSAQQEFTELAMRADVAAVHLVIADLLLDAGQEKQAEWEIRQALPLIEEYKLVPEGFAAMTLLRESLRRQKIDRTALRNLHGYFEELQR